VKVETKTTIFLVVGLLAVVAFIALWLVATGQMS
jgi:hypothetical protein